MPTYKLDTLSASLRYARTMRPAYEHGVPGNTPAGTFPDGYAPQYRTTIYVPPPIPLPTTQIRGTTQIKAGTIKDAQIADDANIQITKILPTPLYNIGSGVNSPAKGDVLVGQSGAWGRKTAGADGRALVADSTKGDGLDWVTMLKPLDSAVVTPVKGDVLVSDGSTWKRKAAGADGKALIADSTKADGLDWGTVASSGGTSGPTVGGMAFISETIISSAVAQVDIQLPLTFSEFDFEIVDVLPATNAASLQVRISVDNGATFDSAANYKSGLYQTNEGSFSANLNAGTVAHWIIANSLSNTATSGGAGGRFTLINTSGSNHKRAISHIGAMASDGNTYNQVASHRWMQTGIITHLRFFFSSGNIASGTIRLYGIARGNVTSVTTPRVVGEVPGGALNGTNTVFTTLSAYTNLAVYLNGVRQKKGTHYTETTANSFTFVTAPASTDVLTVDYGDGPAVSTGGSKVFLKEVTAASSATVDFTSVITSAYDEYEFEIINLLPATTNTIFRMLVSTDNGATWLSTGYHYSSRYFGDAGDSGSGGNAASDAFFLMSGAHKNTQPGIFGDVRILPTSGNMYGYGTVLVNHNNGNKYRFDFMHMIAQTVNAVRFLMDSGNLTSGSVRCYGIAKSIVLSSTAEGFTIPSDSGFSWVNQGAATLDVQADSITIVDVASTTDNMRCRVQVAPATPYTRTAYIEANVLDKSALQYGILLRNSSSGLMVRLVLYGSGSGYTAQVSKMNSATSFNAAYVDNIRVQRLIRWFRVTDDGTNRIFSISEDGKHWMDLHSVGRTDFVTPDQVGWYVDSFNVATPNYALSARLRSWL